MESQVLTPSQSQGLIACCECGHAIPPNPTNMCVGCVRSRVDITEGIPKTAQLFQCKFCLRWHIPPTTWTHAELESKELLAHCLKKIKATITKVRLVDANFIWTEPHSKRTKVKLTVQREVFTGAILQQSFVVEFTHYNQICDECRRAEAKDYWRACVQIRQKCDFKKTLFYLEQLLIKHGAHINTTNIKPSPTGIDFYYARLQDSRKLVDFVIDALPCKYQYSQQLISHDVQNNTFDYKHTFCVELAPVTRDALVILPKKIAQSYGNMGQLLVCLRVTNVISLIDPANLQMNEVSSVVYWKHPFEILCQPKHLVEFYVIDVEPINDYKRGTGHSHVSTKHSLADVWVVRSNNVGASDVAPTCCRTHLGFLLNAGDLVYGYDLKNSNVNNPLFDELKEEDIPDVVLIRKSYDREQRAKNRPWKLRRLIDQEDTASLANAFMGFMEDIEEDPAIRDKINIYRDPTKPVKFEETDGHPTVSLSEMLEDLHIKEEEEMES
jgi:nonsense-mediated mRNA decay protein 3